MRKIIFAFILIIFSSSFLFAQGDFEGFFFKIDEKDLDFYDQMRSGLKIDCDISIIQKYDPESVWDLDFDMLKYQAYPYVIYDDDYRSYVGYQVRTDLVKPDVSILPDDYYNIDNYEIYLDFLDGLGEDYSLDAEYYIEGEDRVKLPEHKITTRRDGDDIIIDFEYDATGLDGNLVDQLDIVIINNLAQMISKEYPAKPHSLVSFVDIDKILLKPSIKTYLNGKLYVPFPRIKEPIITYPSPSAPKSLKGIWHGTPGVVKKISTNIKELTYIYYKLNEVYKRESEAEKHGDSFDVSTEISPYVFNIWAVKHNIVLADYALGFTSSARWKIIDEPKFNLFLGLRSGYMYSATSPVMFTIPGFAEIGVTISWFEIYAGIGGIYSGVFGARFAPGLEAGLGINIPINKHDKLMIGVNANIAATYDTTDIKYLELYSANINPYIGFRHSFSYFEESSKEKQNTGYAAISNDATPLTKSTMDSSNVTFTPLTTSEVNEAIKDKDKVPVINGPGDVNKALKVLKFKSRAKPVTPAKITTLRNQISVKNN